MSVEKKFVAEGISKALVNEYLRTNWSAQATAAWS